MGLAKENDLVLLIARDRKRFIIRLTSGGELHTHRGCVKHDDLIGQPLGREVTSHLGYPFLVLEPSTHDLIKEIKRTTQIVYPKDIGYMLLKLNVRPGSRVVEGGTGSGGLTLALAQSVMPTGHVYSYEVRPDVLALARKNLEGLGLGPYVDLKQRDIEEGFDETDADALFLDVRTPWQYLAQARQALKGGGFFGSIVPTTNQVVRLIEALPQHGFADIEVEELLLRPYKVVPGRLRPMDRMVAHTGYLVFARKIDAPDASQWFVSRRGRSRVQRGEGNEASSQSPGRHTAGEAPPPADSPARTSTVQLRPGVEALAGSSRLKAPFQLIPGQYKQDNGCKGKTSILSRPKRSGGRIEGCGL